MNPTNYGAWDIDNEPLRNSSSDNEKLWQFARYAVLAPSGHNTQPWRFVVADNQLTLWADERRVLAHSGVQANEPLVSLGAFLGAMQLAAMAHGHDVDVEYETARNAVAAVRVRSGNLGRPDLSLLAAIVNRVSNRGLYETEPIDQRLIDACLPDRMGAARCLVLSNRGDIEFVAKETEAATLRVFGDSAFRAELSEWVRNNRTRQHDGMPGFVQGIPTPPSLLAKYVIRHANVAKQQSCKDAERVVRSNNLVLVVANDETSAAVLDAGRAYSQICVRAQHHGIASSGAGAAVIDPASREAVKERFGLTGFPIAILRLGVCNGTARHSPRWPIEAVGIRTD